MTFLLALICLLAAPPAFSQTTVWTNAELGQPLSPNRPTVSAAQLASLAAHQFRSGSFERPWTPMGSTGSSPTGGPFSDYQNVIEARRLDGSLWSEPPWVSVAYGGWSHDGRSAYVPYTAFAVRPRGTSGHGGRSGGRPAGPGASGRPARGR